MVEVYFIGGSKDLSKQMMESPPKHIRALKPIMHKFTSPEQTSPTDAYETEHELYVFVGEIIIDDGRRHKTFMYAIQRD
jgi:hypothetical protein